jgi:putative ABC transport system permease protein
MQELTLALRNLARHRKRSFVALVAISFGVAALLFAGGFIQWILEELREQTIRSQLGHIQITPGGSLEQRSAQDRERVMLPSSGPELDRIKQYPGVKAVAPRLAISGLISFGDTTLSFIADGIDPETDAAAGGGTGVVSGEGLSSSMPRRVIVGEGLAASLGTKPGDRAVLLVNTSRGGINASDVEIGGAFRTVSKAYDDAALRLPIVLARELLRIQGADTWVVTLDRTESTDSALRALQADPALARFEFTPWMALADFYNKAVALYARQFQVVKVLIAIIIVLSISNTLMMSVTERTSEIGTMMAIGTSRSSILRLFVWEGIFLGIVGALAGVVLGFLINTIVSAIGIPMPPAPGMRHGFLAQATFTFPIAFTAMGLALATTALASVYPALRASRLDIVDALRHSR